MPISEPGGAIPGEDDGGQGDRARGKHEKRAAGADSRDEGPGDEPERGRHAAPRRTLLQRLQMPVGKAVALAAMPSAVLLGTGFTSPLAKADPQPEDRFRPGSCVEMPDQPAEQEEEQQAEEAGSGGGERRPGGGAGSTPDPTDPADPSAPLEPTEPTEPIEQLDPGADTGGTGATEQPTEPDPGGTETEQPEEPEEPGTGGDDGGTGESGGAGGGGGGEDPGTSGGGGLLGGLVGGSGGLLGRGDSEETEQEAQDGATATDDESAIDGLLGGESSPSPTATSEPAETGEVSADTMAAEPTPQETAGPEQEETQEPGPVDILPTEEPQEPEESQETLPAEPEQTTEPQEPVDQEPAPGPEPSQPASRDPFAPDEQGRVPFPCPEERRVRGTDEQTPVPLPDRSWFLEASKLTLSGLHYHGVVNVTTENGTTKQVLKFTAKQVDIVDLHQIVDGQGATRRHVSTARGSTSTFRDGTVTMYTERLSGNLFGLVPITFDPEHEPPLDLPFITFTDVFVIQAGQFGGTLTLNGMSSFITEDGPTATGR